MTDNEERAREVLEQLRAMYAEQKWAHGWEHNIVPSGKPAHELACAAIRALPLLFRLAASSHTVDRDHVVVPRAVIEAIVKECDQGDPRTTGARIGGAVIALRRLLSAIPSKETEA